MSDIMQLYLDSRSNVEATEQADSPQVHYYTVFGEYEPLDCTHCNEPVTNESCFDGQVGTYCSPECLDDAEFDYED